MIIKMKEEEKQVIQKKQIVSAKNGIYFYLPEYRMRVL